MTLADYIRSHTPQIAQEWQRFARTCLPAAGAMDEARLRNHALELLAFIVRDMDSAQSDSQQLDKSQGRGPHADEDSEAEKHAILRAVDGFTVSQVMGEFRALRASVLRLAANDPAIQPTVIEITRFNEAIDQMLYESVVRHDEIVVESLRRASREKDEFISTLSHELRNPISAISNGLIVLNASDMADPKASHAVGILNRQTVHLTRLLDDLLDVARISRRRVRLQRETVDLRKCVQDALEGNAAIIAEKGQVVEVNAPDVPVMIFIDCTRIAQVLANLINNAAKYSPAGAGVEVVITSGATYAAIRVRDKGIGIPPDLLPHIFEAFHENRAPNIPSQGLGIGLWLSRQLVEMHGGTITAHSAGANTGTEFCVNIPRQAA